MRGVCLSQKGTALAPLPHIVIGWERGSGANMMIDFRIDFRVQQPGQLHALQAEI